MKYFLQLFLCILLTNCNDRSVEIEVVKPLQKNDYWIKNFKKSKLNTANFVYKNNKIYASTIEFGNLQNYFYCFDLITGKVLWAQQVSNNASFNPIVLDDIIYYVTYVGDRYAFDILGNKIWERNFQNSPDVSLSLNGMTYNTLNHNLILTGIFDGIFEFNKVNGDKVNHIIPSDSAMIKMPKPVFIDRNIYFANECYESLKKSSHKIEYNSITCQDYFTNEIKWSKPIKVEMLYSNLGNIYANSKDTLYCLNGKTGDIKWTLPLEGYILYMKNKIMLYPYYKSINYTDGEEIPYVMERKIHEYIISDDKKEYYKIQITTGSFNSNDPFEDTHEVVVEKL